MNLADAIRKAALEHRPMPQAAVFTPTHEEEEPEVVVAPLQDSLPQVAEETPMPEQEHAHAQPNTLVRMELLLTPEQLSSLFRAVVANQHTMLTAREAAGLLRIPTHSVEEMALAGDLPGFQVDGKWRFARNAIEEWMQAQGHRKEAA